MFMSENLSLLTHTEADRELAQGKTDVVCTYTGGHASVETWWPPPDYTPLKAAVITNRGCWVGESNLLKGIGKTGLATVKSLEIALSG